MLEHHKWGIGPLMFTIEHEFDSSVITLVDEGSAKLQEDIIIHAFEDCVTIEQVDPKTDQVQRLTLSIRQVEELGVALDLPEGTYRDRNMLDL